TRGIEVQVLVNLEYKDKKTGAVTATSHGDLFSIWGADCTPDRPHPLGWKRCLPSEYRAKGGGEWNHYKVVANDGVIKLHVNGMDLGGWKTEKGAWKAAGGKLVSTGGRELVSEKAYGACELIFDCKLPAKGGGRCEVAVGAVTLGFLPGGDGVVSVSGDQGRS